MSVAARVLACCAISAGALSVGTPSASAVQFCNTTPVAGPTGPAGPSAPYPSSISVSGLGTVTDVNVVLSNLNTKATTMDVGHWPSDLDIQLVSPDGTRSAMIMSDAGGDNETSRPLNAVTVTLDDQAPNALPTDSQLSNGTYRPIDDDDDASDGPDTFAAPAPAPGAAALSAFNGTPANGAWSLFVVDDLAGGATDISGGWCLDVTASTPPDTTITSPNLRRTRDRTPTFTFASTPAGATFECRVDGQAWVPCTTPFTTPTLRRDAAHTFYVRAVSSAGTDPTPAKDRFRVR